MLKPKTGSPFSFFSPFKLEGAEEAEGTYGFWLSPLPPSDYSDESWPSDVAEPSDDDPSPKRDDEAPDDEWAAEGWARRAARRRR